jgi:myo-inositol-1(or 4)-monophosphatase
MTLEEKYHALLEEVKAVGLIAKAYFDSDDIANELKEDQSVVTKIDKEVEAKLRLFVTTHFPEDSIVGEEEDDVKGTSSFVWHIDPIDGTDNFLRKIPFCAISVARLGDTTEDSFAIIYNPIAGHLFSSFMEGGCYENSRITNLTAEPLGGKYVVGMGRGSRSGEWTKKAMYKIMESVGTKYGRCGPYHCSALELAYLSAGRIDAYLTFGGLGTYDYAAGLYLVRAAGGKISVFEEGGWKSWEGSIKDLCDVHGKTIFASHPDIHDEMRDFIGDPKAWVEATG